MLSQGFDIDTIGSIPSEKHVLLTDRFIMEVGLFSNSKSVVMNVDGTMPSNPIDFGETLGLGRHGNTVDINFTWRFSKEMKWFTSLNYFAIRNFQTVVLQEYLKWNNSLYPVGAKLNSAFDVDLLRLFFGRIISSGEKHELSGGIGLHTMNIRTYLQAVAYLGPSDIELDLTKKEINFLAPVPNIGFRYLYAPTTRWAFSAHLEWFSLQVGDYKGTLWDVTPAVSYQFSRNFGLGLSYKYFKANVGMNRDVWKGSADLLYQGPLISVNGNF
ncbi:hypothetical protein [Lutimonas sp.]|uniref:hypothetical protein n=1 Tax=Lutimonas sp. TaxID=1872403 RepID=UPI003D9B18E4